MKTIILKNDQSRAFCETMLRESPLDGSQTVIFKKTDKSGTTAQRRLQWLWYTEVSQSGLGQDDDKESVHIRAKLMFAHPILIRDDETYAILYRAFRNAVKTSANYAARIKEFASQYISTERLTKRQRAEYLTEFQRYWVGHGANLTDPSLQGVDLSIWEKT